MKSITIHNLDDPLDSLIREKAKKEGLSLNNTIKKLLAESLGLSPKKGEERKRDFLDLFGVWSDRDVQDFKKRIIDLEKIDPGEWL
jgi:plasmid stability protein